MRVVPLLLLSFLLIGGGACRRLNPEYCDDQNPTCPSGEACHHLSQDSPRPGRCETAPCTTSANCSAAAPVCDLSVSFACVGCSSDNDCSAYASSTTAGTGGFCVQGSCRECQPASPATYNTACTARYPDLTASVCQDSGASAGICRGCALHSECAVSAGAGGVCAKDGTLANLASPIPQGVCPPASRVITVTANGPTTLNSAVTTAGANQPFILVTSLPTAAGRLTLDTSMDSNLSGANIHVIGPMADQSPAKQTSPPQFALEGTNLANQTSAVLVANGAQVTLEGLVLGTNQSSYGLSCGGTTSTKVGVTLLRSVVTANATVGVLVASNCTANVQESWIGQYQPIYSGQFGAGNPIGVLVTAGGVLNLASSVVYGNGAGSEGAVQLQTGAPAAAQASIVNSTLVGLTVPQPDSTPRLIGCDSGTSLVLFNTYLYGAIQGDAAGRNVASTCLQAGSYTNVATDEVTPSGPNAVAAAASGADFVSLTSQGTALPDLTLSSSGVKNVGTAGHGGVYAGVSPPAMDMAGKALSPTAPPIGAFAPGS